MARLFIPLHPSTPDLFTVSTVLSFPGCYRVGITQEVASSDWLLLPTHVPQKFLLSFHGSIAPFFSVLSNIPLLEGPQFIYPSLLKGIPVALRFWQLRIQLLQTFACMFLCGCRFSESFGWSPRGVTAESCGESGFSFIRNCRAVAHRGCTVWHPHQLRVGIPAAPCPRLHLVLSGPGFRPFEQVCVIVGLEKIIFMLFSCLFSQTPSEKPPSPSFDCSHNSYITLDQTV